MEDNNTTDDQRLRLLVLRAQSGDRSAIDRLLSDSQHDLFVFLLNMLHNHADAEDALQATMLQVVRKLRWLRNPSLFRPWIYRIASRVAFRATKTRRQLLSDPEIMHDIAAADDSAEPLDELIDQIPQWLEQLTVKCREAVVLHYLNGFTTEQVAEILDIPPGTAKSRISYALTCIRKWVQPVRRPHE